jgi:hypothetical protein
MFYKELFGVVALALTFEEAQCYLCVRPSRGLGTLTDTGVRQQLAAGEAFDSGYRPHGVHADAAGMIRRTGKGN